VAKNADCFVEPYAVTNGTRLELRDHDPDDSAGS